MLVVNTNVSSLKAQRELTRTRSSLSTAMERISSGVRLNSAQDDAVGMAISERMTSQIKGLSMAIKNANDGMGFLQTAEGSLQEVTNLMQQMRELAVKAIDGANSSADLASMQGQVLEMNMELTRIAMQTELNGKKLLSGEVVNEKFQIGIRADQTLDVSIDSVLPKKMGSYFTTTDNALIDVGVPGAAPGVPRVGSFGEAPTNAVVAQVMTLRGFASSVTASSMSIEDGESASSIAKKINAEEDRTGVSATAKTTLTLEGLYDPAGGGAGVNTTQTVTFRLYGKNEKIEGVLPDDPLFNAQNITANISGNDADGLNPLISAINARTVTTGIVATFVPPDPLAGKEGRIELVQEEGYDISLEAFQHVGSAEDPSNPFDHTITVQGMDGADPVQLTEGGDDSVTVGGVVTLHSFKPFTVTSDGPQDNSLFRIGFDGTPQGAGFSALEDVDFLEKGGPARALQVITDGLDTISSMRAHLGTIQNRFESVIANLGSVLENAEAARSRIYDADFAEETARLTKAQILQEAGIAVLAQANTIPQAVLALLRA